MRNLSVCLCLPFLFCPLFLRAGETLPSSASPVKAQLVRIVREEGFDVEALPPAEYEGTGGSILVRVPARQGGTQKAQTKEPSSPEMFILGVPFPDGIDEPGEASGKFPFGIETARAFLKIMRETQTDKAVAVAFLEDEEGVYRGLGDLISSLDYPENVTLMYLNFSSLPPGKIVIHHEVRGSISPLAIVRPLPGILEKKGIPYSFMVRSHELYKLGLAEGPAVLEYAHRREVPAILLTAGGDVSDAVTADLLAEALAGYADAIYWETGGQDTHYSLFAYGNRIFFLSEGLTLILILFLAGIGITIWIVRSVPHRLRKNKPLQAGMSPQQFELHETPPSASNASVPLRKTPGEQGVRRWADHCAHIAVFLAILGILGGAFLDLSCAPAFIWSLAFTILGAVLRFAPAVFICALLSPFKGTETVFQTLRGGTFTAPLVSLNPGIYPLLALLLLPFLLLVLRGIILTGERK